MKVLTEAYVLVVDDEVGLCEAICFDLEQSGYQCFQAHTVQEALSVMNTLKMDAVVSDIRMPGGSGLDLLEITRAQGPVPPLFMLMTGYAAISEKEAVERGCYAMLAKPFDPELLLDLLKRGLDRDVPEEDSAKDMLSHLNSP